MPSGKKTGTSVKIAGLELSDAVLFKVSINCIVPRVPAVILVTEAARPEAAPGPFSPVYMNLHTADVDGNVNVSEYTNFSTPGMDEVRLTHAEVSTEHKGCTSPNESDESIFRKIDDTEVVPLYIQTCGVLIGSVLKAV